MRRTVNLIIVLFMSVIPSYSQSVVDVHCHDILPDFVKELDVHDAALDETFPLPAWDVNSQLAFMDSAGIKTSDVLMYNDYIFEYQCYN